MTVIHVVLGLAGAGLVLRFLLGPPSWWPWATTLGRRSRGPAPARATCRCDELPSILRQLDEREVRQLAKVLRIVQRGNELRRRRSFWWRWSAEAALVDFDEQCAISILRTELAMRTPGELRPLLPPWQLVERQDYRARAAELLRDLAATDLGRLVAAVVAYGRRQLEAEREAEPPRDGQEAPSPPLDRPVR